MANIGVQQTDYPKAGHFSTKKRCHRSAPAREDDFVPKKVQVKIGDICSENKIGSTEVQRKAYKRRMSLETVGEDGHKSWSFLDYCEEYD